MGEMVITIDGPAGSGKSTVARLLAEEIGAAYLDTGAMYRAVTLAVMKAGVDLEDQEKLLSVLVENEFDFSVRDGVTVVKINGADVTEEIRLPQVTAKARYIASAEKIRGRLVQMQRQFADDAGMIVTEGRDQGTVAFPDAKFKFFLVAGVEERARRRLKDLQGQGNADELSKVKEAIIKRDKSDMARAVGPLKPAADAIEIDTTSLDIGQVVQKLLEIVKSDA